MYLLTSLKFDVLLKKMLHRSTSTQLYSCIGWLQWSLIGEVS